MWSHNTPESGTNETLVVHRVVTGPCWCSAGRAGPIEEGTMGRELMAPRTDRTTRIPFGVASSVTTNHAAKGSVFVNIRNAGNFNDWPARQGASDLSRKAGREIDIYQTLHVN